MNRNRTYRSIVSVGCVIALVAVPSLWVARLYHQQAINHALIVAIKQSDASKVDALLSEGADPNMRDTPLNQETLFERVKRRIRPSPPDLSPTALIVALHLRRSNQELPLETPAIVRALLARGANVNPLDWDQQTAIQSILYAMPPAGRTQLLEILLSAGATTDDTGILAVPPIFNLIDSGETECIRLLLDHGADIEAHCGDETPLAAASRIDRPDIVRLLLDRGANTEARDQDGQTPLVGSFTLYQYDIARILLQHGANANSRDNAGHTPLWIARYLGRSDIVTLLKAHGSKL